MCWRLEIISKVILIPAYNEETTIARVIESIKKYEIDVIVIDDGSKDKTARNALTAHAKLLQLSHKGKGNALRAGMKLAIQENYDYVICMDADLQHKTTDIPNFLGLLREENNVEIVIGSRFIRPTKIPFSIALINTLHTVLLNKYLNLRISDYACGFRAFKKESILKMNWKSNGYAVEIEQLIIAKKLGLKIIEIPVHIDYSISKKPSLSKILSMTTEIHLMMYGYFLEDFKGIIFFFPSLVIFLISLALLLKMVLFSNLGRVTKRKPDLIRTTSAP